MPRLVFFNKPYEVLCQFTPEPGVERETLKTFIPIPEIYPAGRLDADSEGLLVLTDDGGIQHHISSPKHKWPKTYWVQVDGEIDEAAIQRLTAGVTLRDFVTQPCKVSRLQPPAWLWPRHPPIRVRKNIPTSWIEIVLREGKNRQIRKMTAQVGFPTLRLIRYAIGPWTVQHLPPGQWRDATGAEYGLLGPARIATGLHNKPHTKAQKRKK